MSLGEPKTLMRFAAVGAVNTIVGLAAVVVATRALGLNDYLANGIGFAAGMVVGYLLNRLWTFGSDDGVARTGLRYAFAFLVSYAANLAILSILLSAEPVDPIVAQAAALAGYSLVFYLLCWKIVFARSR